MRFVFRLLSLIALVAAVIEGTVDAVASVAANAVRLTTLSTAWSYLLPGTVETVHARAEASPAAPILVTMLDWLLMQPVVALLLVAALVFYCAGYRRRRLPRRYAAR